ncbi:MAG: hypothetical protein KJZ72_14690 [Anaerolineales bacterium]|nr:hypothetical protein [Anaerolineales bacterium]
MYLIPWLLRAVSIVVWLISTFISITTLHKIYSPFTDVIPIFALQFGVILLMVQWSMYGLRNGQNVWGLLFAGAITLWGISQAMTWLSNHWQYADLFFRILPPALLGVGMITLSIRTRTRRMSRVSSNKNQTTNKVAA